jgi:hypothetical protein
MQSIRKRLHWQIVALVAIALRFELQPERCA